MPRQQLRNSSGLTSGQLTALDATPIYAKHFPAAGSYTLSTEVPGFSSNNGWMLCKFVCTTLPTASASMYPATIHDGSSSNIIGVRIENSTTLGNLVKSYLRVSGSNKVAEVSDMPLYANEIKTAIFVWKSDGTQYFIVDDEYTSSTQTSARGFTPTTLQVGARNGGSDSLTGRVLYLEIGNTYLEREAASMRLRQCRKPLVIATAGQSNIQNWEDGVETTAPSGHAGFIGIISSAAAAGCPGEIVVIHGAEGGSSLFYELNNTEYWVEDDGSPGPELYQLFQRVKDCGHKIDYLLWDEGETESHKIDASGTEWLTKEVYKARLLHTLQLIRNENPGMEVFIGILGRRTGGYTNTGGIQKIVEAQLELIDSYPWIHFGWSKHDLQVYTDDVHYYDAAYTTMGQRAARNLQKHIGFPITGSTLGPKLVSSSRSGTSLTITISHDQGSDFTPTTNIEGFKYINSNGSDVALSSVARASATTITATLASAIAGTLYYIYDDADSVDTANMVVDNSATALPLRRGKVSVA